MNDDKFWYESKAIWGSIATVAASLVGFIGYQVDPSFITEISSIGVMVGTVAGAIWAIYGRVKAVSKLVRKKVDV